MDGPAKSVVTFTLNGARFVLDSGMVDSRLSGVLPEVVTKHAVRVNETWYPVMQAFEIVTGVKRSEFISHTARRHFAALGYELHGRVESRSSSSSGSGPEAPPRVSASTSTRAVAEEWHTEANVQAAVVTALASSGWRVLSVADTSARARGIDVVATKGEETVGVEVKGFPSRSYADPARSSEIKPTAPSTQAGHWYSQAVLAAMRLRGKQPSWRSAIALPDFPRYRDLYSETRGSLVAAGIEVWWVDPQGGVDRG